MNSIAGKKVLIFGGIGPMGDLITLAHRNHVTVGVADYNKDTYLKREADYSHDINILDVDTVVDLYQREHYDGIITNFNDMLMPFAADVAEKVGAFVPYTKEQIRMSTDKKYFKEKCLQYGLPVPKEYAISSDYSDIEYPDDCIVDFDMQLIDLTIMHYIPMDTPHLHQPPQQFHQPLHQHSPLCTLLNRTVYIHHQHNVLMHKPLVWSIILTH